MDYDFLIIGGGIAGLQIGALCSTLGKTIIVEKTSQIGGRARVTNHKGFLLDWGPHPVRFGPKSSIAETLKDIKAKPVEFIDPGLTYAYLSDGTRHIFPSGIKGYLKSKMIPIGKTVIFLLKLYKNYKKYPERMLGTSFKDYFIQDNTDYRIQRFLSIGSASMQVNPFLERSSIGEFLLNILQILKKKSVFYPKGGWNTFYSRFSQAISQNDGAILLNSKVQNILLEESTKTAYGIELTNGDKIRSNIIISTIPIQQLFKILNPKYVSTEFAQRCKDLRQTAGICIDFCITKPITNETLIFLEDPPSFGIIPTNMSAEVAPDGKSLMSFFMPTEIETIKNPEKRDKSFQHFRSQILRIYPEIEKYIEYERPLYLDMVDGIEIAIDQNRINRPKPEELKIHNLFLTGDSIGGEGAGGDVGHTSVRECYKKIKTYLESKPNTR